MSQTFTAFCRVTYSTKRVPATSAGLGGVPTANLTGKKCTALIPPGNADELRQAQNIPARYKIWEMHTAETDIKDNPPDVIVVGSTEYPVITVEKRTIGGEIRTRVVMMEIVR